MRQAISLSQALEDIGTEAALRCAQAIVLETKDSQRRRFEILALKDELTGAPNRRSMLEHMRRECARAAAARQDLIISMLDIDFFKKVNDIHGHDAGNAVLKAIYGACKAKLRPQDILGRWGGEEFVLVAPGANETALHALFEQLSDAVKTMNVPELQGERTITFSMGACRVAGDAAPDIEKTLARADEALYAAKEAGRACCHIAVDDDTPLPGLEPADSSGCSVAPKAVPT